MITLCACESKIGRINIHGTYKSNSMMGYEAEVDKGTITIYSISPFEKNIYWYGTCNASELDKDNKIISKRLEIENNRNWFFSDFGMGRSGAREKEILFTENSLTFIYDMSGMAINQVTLYKESSKRKNSEFDSNAERLPETIPIIPYEIPNEKPGESETGKQNETLPKGEDYSL